MAPQSLATPLIAALLSISSRNCENCKYTEPRHDVTVAAVGRRLRLGGPQDEFERVRMSESHRRTKRAEPEPRGATAVTARVIGQTHQAGLAGARMLCGTSITRPEPMGAAYV